MKETLEIVRWRIYPPAQRRPNMWYELKTWSTQVVPNLYEFRFSEEQDLLKNTRVALESLICYCSSINRLS